MNDQLSIDLRPSRASLAAAYGMLAFITAGLTLAGVLQRSFVPLILAALALGVGIAILSRITRPKTLILTQHGITLRDRKGETAMSWADIQSIVLRRIPKANGTEPAVLIRARDGRKIKLLSHYTITPQQLFTEIDTFVKAQSIAASTTARPLHFSLENWLPES